MSNLSPYESNAASEVQPTGAQQAAPPNEAGDAATRQLDAAEQLVQQARSPETEVFNPRDTDAAIQQYMAALLARSQDPKATAIAQAAPPMAAPAAPSSPLSEPAPDEPARAERKKAQPESHDAISELRELANINARSSFNVHHSRQLIYELYNCLAVTLVSLVVSFALIGFAESKQSLPFFAAIIAFLVAIRWSSRYLQLARTLRRTFLPQRPAVSDEDAPA